MRQSPLLLVVAVVLSGAGAMVSVMLLQTHLSGSTGSAWFDEACSSDEDSSMNCGVVLASDWAYFPPKDETGQRRPVSVPVALLGLWYFTGLAVWYLFVGRPDYEARQWHLVPLAWNGLGIVASVFFLIVMFTKMEVACPWCLVTHGLNALTMICTALLWPVTTSGSVADMSVAASSESLFDAAGASTPQATSRLHPTKRQAVTTIVLGLALASTQFYWSSALSLFQQAKQLQLNAATSVKTVERIKEDGKLMLALLQQQPRREIAIAADDPIRGEGRGLFDVVVFSDFQCPRCRDFAQRLDTQIEELFGGDLRIVFKHFPLCRDCNARVGGTRHPHACQAARAAEAARLQGGSGAFWAMHDRLFADQEELASFDYRGVAAELGLSPDRLLADMESDAVTRRIHADVELAARLDVRATPTAFVSGRRVESIARSSDAFWKELHALYRRALDRRAADLNPATDAGASPTEPPESTAPAP